MSVHISGLRHAYTVVMITEAQRRVKERVERRRKTRKASEIRFEVLPNGQAGALHRSACVWHRAAAACLLDIVSTPYISRPSSPCRHHSCKIWSLGTLLGDRYPNRQHARCLKAGGYRTR